MSSAESVEDAGLTISYIRIPALVLCLIHLAMIHHLTFMTASPLEYGLLCHYALSLIRALCLRPRLVIFLIRTHDTVL